MRKIPTAGVSRELLEFLFQEFDLWAKIANGRLLTKPVPEKDVPSKGWSNATSRILKHFTPNGKHIATTHCIVADGGRVVHQDAKDFVIDEVRLWRF